MHVHKPRLKQCPWMNKHYYKTVWRTVYFRPGIVCSQGGLFYAYYLTEKKNTVLFIRALLEH